MGQRVPRGLVFLPRGSALIERIQREIGSGKCGWVYISIIVVVVIAIARALLTSNRPAGDAHDQNTSSPPSASATSNAVTATTNTAPVQVAASKDLHKAYAVKVKETVVTRGKKDVTLNLVYRKAPTTSAAYSAIGAEVAAYMSANHDPAVESVSGFAHVGDPESKESWVQMKDPQRGYVWAWYDAKTNAVIKHFYSPEVVVPNVLSGGAAAIAAEQEKSEEADRFFEKKKTAAVGVRLLKQNMRNPGSFELVEVGISSTGSICYRYRAQNGFGGMNVEEAVFGNTFKTTGQDGFVTSWNKECGGKTLTIVTEDVETILQLAGG